MFQALHCDLIGTFLYAYNDVRMPMNRRGRNRCGRHQVQLASLDPTKLARE